MIESATLNDFSRGFFEELKERFPDVASKAVIDDEPTAAPGSLLVRFAPDESRPKCFFLLMTDRGEITVGFDMYHSHFSWPSQLDEWQLDPLAFIDALVNDRILIEVTRDGGKWMGSRVVEAEHQPDAPSTEGEQTISIRSWSGRLDRDYPE